MPTVSAPVKTPLGQDEMRHRTRGLGQRYRTVLLLVDGRRPLGEVLAMAHQAGAQTSHFEELVRLGLVELPREAAAPEPQETAPGALDMPRLTSVELEVTLEEPIDEAWKDTPTTVDLPLPDLEPALPPAPPPQASAAMTTSFPPALSPEPLDALDTPLARRPADATPPSRPTATVLARLAELMVGPQPAPPTPPPPAPAPAKAKRAVAPPVPPAAPARYVEPVLDLSQTPRAPEWTQVREAPFKVADHARPAPHVSEGELLQMVRELLLDTLRRDTLLFGTFAAGRVRAAQTHRELIKLVWEIERDRAHPRRSRDQLLNLQRARELLGMGNTLVAWDSQPSVPDDD